MLTKRQIKYKKQLLSNIDRALLQPYPQYWLDALEEARISVIESYPLFNSNSTIYVACSVTGKIRPILVKNLYRGFGVYECAAARSSRALKLATEAAAEKINRKGLTDSQKKSFRCNIKIAKDVELERMKNEGLTYAQKQRSRRAIKKAHNSSVERVKLEGFTDNQKNAVRESIKKATAARLSKKNNEDNSYSTP